MADHFSSQDSGNAPDSFGHVSMSKKSDSASSVHSTASSLSSDSAVAGKSSSSISDNPVAANPVAANPVGANPVSDNPASSIVSNQVSESDKTVIRSEVRNLSADQLLDSNIDMTQFVGLRLGDFLLENYIGGSSSAVYRAKDLILERDVAIKILLPHQTTQEMQKRFQNEAKACARLNHDNIARIHFAGQANGLNFIVFEYVPGNNLRRIVEELGPLPLEMAIKNTLQITLALQHAYENQVTHRDVKPSNSVVSKGGHVKLVDMGLARQLTGTDGDLTADGVTLGTFDYLSPEQAEDPRKADVRSDLYSLGCTLYFMLTGQPPFPNGSPVKKVLHHNTAPRPDPRRMRPELPREVSTMIKKLLAPKPENRYQTPKQLIADLLKFTNKSNLRVFSGEQEFPIHQKQLPQSLIERLAPVAIPVLAIILCVLGWEFLIPKQPADSGLSRVADEMNQLKGGMSVDPIGDAVLKANQPAAIDSEKNSKSRMPSRPFDANELKKISKNSNDRQGKSLAASAKQADKIALNKTTSNVDDGKVRENDAEKSRTQRGTIETVKAPTTVDEFIVGQPAGETPVNVAVFETLNEALAAMPKFGSLKKIKLCFDGVSKTGAFDLYVDELMVVAGDGFTPIIEMDANVDTDDNTLIQIRGGNVSFNGIHFHLKTPKTGIRDGISLFDVQQIRNLQFMGCSLTIENSDSDSEVWQPNVAFFQIRPALLKRSDMPQEMRMVKPVVQLNDFVIRGHATAFRAQKATPFSIELNNGLIVTPERLFEVGGAETRPEIYNNIELTLRNVTSATGNGLGLVSIDVEAPHPMLVAINAISSIFKVGLDSPLVRHENVDLTSELKNYLQIDGEKCYFPKLNPIWVIGDRIRTVTEKRFDLDNSLLDSDWFQLRLPRVISELRWNISPKSIFKPAHLQTPVDHELMINRASSFSKKDPGFDRTLMPKVPIEAMMPMPKPTSDRDEKSSAVEKS